MLVVLCLLLPFLVSGFRVGSLRMTTSVSEDPNFEAHLGAMLRKGGFDVRLSPSSRLTLPRTAGKTLL